VPAQGIGQVEPELPTHSLPHGAQFRLDTAADGERTSLLNHEFRGDLGQEPAGVVALHLTKLHSLGRMGEEELPLGPGHAHIAEAPLLLDGQRVDRGSTVREEPLLQADQEHAGKLQPLRGMQGHQGHELALVPHGIDIGHERDVFEEAREGAVLRPLGEGGSRVYELSHVLEPSLGLSGTLRLEGVLIATSGQHFADDGLGWRFSGKVDQSLHDRPEAAYRGSAPAQLVGMLIGLQRDREEGQVTCLGEATQALDGAGADAARGRVDHTEQRDAVVGVEDDSEVGKDVANLPPLVEALSTYELVWDPFVREGLLEQAGLGIRAEEDREGAE